MREINIIWFKRDLRLTDHAPLAAVVADQRPTLLLYFFEPSLMRHPASDYRHWWFAYQSITDMRDRLSVLGIRLYTVHAEVLPFFKEISLRWHIQNIFSYRETGLKLTFERDKAVKRWCREQNIYWEEFPSNGVIRGLSNRTHWRKHWYQCMGRPVDQVELSQIISVDLPGNLQSELPDNIKSGHPAFQKGGEREAWKYLRSFLEHRIINYNQHISKPENSRRSCSRLSPYLAWGNISLRQVFQAASRNRESDSRNRRAFLSRLRWRDHFIQKFESEHRYEYENLNRGYDMIRTEWDEMKYSAWEDGKTGYPLVDACIHCVKATGYLNFRMRSMLISFLTHHLWLDWKRGADFLARQFLDFEPGIHYPQVQMQAGVTGINTIRIYNPVKQALDHDPDAVFIRKWLPHLDRLPVDFALHPWKMTALDQQAYRVRLGNEYPYPLVQIKKTYRHASNELYRMKKDSRVMEEARRILRVHTEPDRMP